MKRIGKLVKIDGQMTDVNINILKSNLPQLTETMCLENFIFSTGFLLLSQCVQS